MRNSIPTIKQRIPAKIYITDRKVFLEPKRLVVDNTKYLDELKVLTS